MNYTDSTDTSCAVCKRQMTVTWGQTHVCTDCQAKGHKDY